MTHPLDARAGRIETSHLAPHCRRPTDRPPWASTIERQIDSPIPRPLDLVVKKALNSRFAFSAEIPTPQSVTLTQTCVRVVLTGSDHQVARPIGDRLHCLNTVHHQIDDHLLQLDPITEDRGQSRRKLRSQRYPVIDQLALHQRDGLLDDVVEVERRLLNVGLVRKRADAADHVARPDAVVDDPFHRAPRSRPGRQFRGRASAGRPRRWRRRRRAAGSLHGRWRRSVRPASSRALHVRVPPAPCAGPVRHDSARIVAVTSVPVPR